jgi:hypothetical protein
VDGHPCSHGSTSAYALELSEPPRLAALERHLGQVYLPVLGQDGPCCSAAAAVRDQSDIVT